MKVILWDHLGVVQGHWGVAENGLNFENSLKMKISMVVAFVHMVFGTLLKMVNELKRGQIKHFYFDSLPKLTIMFPPSATPSSSSSPSGSPTTPDARTRPPPSSTL